MLSESGATTALEISDDITLETLRSLIETDLRVPSQKQLLFVNSRRLDLSINNQTLKEAGLSDGDVIVLGESLAPTSVPQVRPNVEGSSSSLADVLRTFDFSRERP